MTRWRDVLLPPSSPQRPAEPLVPRASRFTPERGATTPAGEPGRDGGHAAASDAPSVSPDPIPDSVDAPSVSQPPPTLPSTGHGWSGRGDRERPFVAEPPAGDGIDLVSTLRILRRRAWVVILCVLLVAGGIYAYSSQQQKSYVASASVLFSDPGFDQTVVAPNARSQSTDPEREAATNLRLVEVRPVAARTARALGNSLTPESVASHVSVTAEGKSNVASIEATASAPNDAARLATTYAEQYIAYRRTRARAQILDAQAVVRGRLAALERTTRDARNLPQSELSQQQSNALDEERTLRQQANELRVLASLQNGGAELVEAALPPDSPAEPQTVRNSALGAVLGLLLGLCLAFVFERFDRYVKEPAQLRGRFHQPVLGRLPKSRALRRPTKYIGDALPAVAREAFRLLWANLRFYDTGRDVRSLLVTSAVPREGKTTVALHVGATAASTGTRTLLIEADLRQPSLARTLGISPEPGLVEVIHGEVTLEDAVHWVRLPTVDGMASYEALPAGRPFRNPPVLLQSPAFRHLLREAEERYGLVVLDTPSTALVSDAISLLTEVSGVLVVTRLGQSTRSAMGQLATQLENVDAPVVGLVINSLSGRSLAEDYGGALRDAPSRA
jgi:capsular exopolysaccharide synthesis family protein